MNDMKRLSIDECIEGLKWKVLRILDERYGYAYVRLIDIRTETGIKDKLASAEGEGTYDHFFTGRLLESLLYEGCVEKRFYAGNRREWRITDRGSEKHMLINETQQCDLEEFIYGLEEVILDSMIELGGDSAYIRLKYIADKCGFEDKLHRVAGEPAYNNYFTHTLLHYLLRERRVDKHPIRPGVWKVTSRELQKRRK